MSKELEAFELLCRFLVEEINTLRHKDLNEDYFYNEKYGVTITDIKTGIEYTTANIASALKRLENYEKNEDLYKDVISYSCLDEEDKIKKLKSLETIKESEKICQEYLQGGGTITIVCKTKEQYDLLMGVLP